MPTALWSRLGSASGQPVILKQRYLYLEAQLAWGSQNQRPPPLLKLQKSKLPRRRITPTWKVKFP